MAFPVSAVLGAFQIASSIAGFGAQRREARRQRETIARNTQLAYEDLDTQAIEMQQATTDKVGLRARQGLLERGRLEALFADSGAVGNTQMRIRRESMFNEGDDTSLMKSNLRKGLRQIQRQKVAAYENAGQQMLSAKGPSVLGLLGGIAGTVAANKDLSGWAQAGADRVGAAASSYASRVASRFRIPNSSSYNGVQAQIGRIYG